MRPKQDESGRPHHLRYKAKKTRCVSHGSVYGSNIQVLDSGMYACIYLDCFDDEIPYAHKLLQYCKKHNYALTGDYICEEMTEFNVFDTRQRNMFLRLQVPVGFQK